jgi:hypothetical protein
MSALIRCILIGLVLLLCVPATGVFAGQGTLSPVIQPEECDIELPTEEEAVARLRVIGVPEHAASTPTPTEDVGDLGLLPAIPAGKEIYDSTLQQELIGSLRRLFACQYLDVVMTIFSFTSDDMLRDSVSSIEAFRDELADWKAEGPDANREVHKQALWEVFGLRQIDTDRFGLFAVQGITSDPLGQQGWADFTVFYIFTREGEQFFFDDMLPLGEICEYGDHVFIPDSALIPSGATPSSDQICTWRFDHR